MVTVTRLSISLVFALCITACWLIGGAAAAAIVGATAADCKDNGQAGEAACDLAALAVELLKTPTWPANGSATVEAALRKAVERKGVYGAAIALTPAAVVERRVPTAPGASRLHLYSPYCHEPPATPNDTTPASAITCSDIGDVTDKSGYDYTNATLAQTEWFVAIAKKGADAKPHLTSPYYDSGGGNTWMRTFSVPVFDKNGTLLAVAGTDTPTGRPPSLPAVPLNGAAPAAPAATAKLLAACTAAAAAILI